MGQGFIYVTVEVIIMIPTNQSRDSVRRIRILAKKLTPELSIDGVSEKWYLLASDTSLHATGDLEKSFECYASKLTIPEMKTRG